MIFVANYRRVFRAAAIIVLMTICGGISAQTVSISPKTGNVVSNLSYESESSLNSFGGIWLHNQLPMTLITSDEKTITDDGLMKVHANNVSAQGGQLIFASGSSSSTINHMSLSLPKGYRFTSYKLVMDYDTSSENKAASVFKEMDSKFSSEKVKVTVGKNQKNVTLQRTSLNDEDMGNILYFRQEHSEGMARVKVVSFVITFECTDKFGEILRPDASDLSSSAVSCVSLPFQTQRVDLGEIEWATKGGYASYKYNYENVKDLAADFLFYDESGVVNGKAVAGTVGNKSIVALGNADVRTFLGVKNNTYWLETPTEALAQDKKTEIPVGYRIVGARVVFSNSVNIDIKKGDKIYITDGNGNFMNSSLKFTDAKVAWVYNTNGTVSTEDGKTYLVHNKRWVLFEGYVYSLSTTSKSSDADVFETDGLNLFYKDGSKRYVISYNDDGNAVYNIAQKYAEVFNANDVTPANHSFKLSVYDKTGENIFKTVEVNKDNPFGDIVLEKINNDAIKLQVEGLEGDNLAYLCLEVQLEALNPYIDKMDITCTDPTGNKTLKNQYLADDFTIGLDGKVDFAVPAIFGDKNLKFAFDGLHHKNADETYTNIGTLGQYSRYHFVKSEYYNIIGENLQGHSSEAADYDYTKKIAVSKAGDKQFVCNNSDKFAAGTSGNDKFYYTEYRYSNDAYSTQGGNWIDVTVNSGDDYQKRYLIVCDETRYNIAPTTKPRHAYYAYYSTDLKLTTIDYTPEITYTKVYDNGVLPTGPDANMYVGAKVSLKDNSSNVVSDGTGYVYAKQIVEQINKDITNKKEGAPVDTKHILYFDASKLNSVLFSSTDESCGKLEDLQQILGENALIYLPQGVTYGMKNIATRSLAGDDFVASNDIEIQDQKPFFAPYKIRMNAANEVKYERLVTNNNDTKKWVSLVLPFTIAVDKATGEYKTMGDNGEFTFYTMNSTNAFSNAQDVDELAYDVDAHFSPYIGQEVTQANYPYLVGIDRLEAGTAADKLLFIIRQKGATIEASPTTLAGETSSGTVKGTASTLQCYGTYSGATIAKENGIFYFNRDKFISSLVLDNRYSTVKVLPFRSYYVSKNPTKMRYMYISTDENTESGTSDINMMPNSISDAGFAYSASEGQLTLTALKNMNVAIRSINGQTFSTAKMANGETQSFTLPSGIYVVNGTKVVVR